MGIRIPLVPMTKRDDAKGHIYPFQIAIQTQEFLQASIFYSIFTNIATSEYVRIEGKLEEIEIIFTQGLYSKNTYDEAWGFFKKYLEVFRKSSSQSVLISMNSHWDWYIRKLSRFIEFARSEVRCSPLNSRKTNEFKRIGNASISHQLEILQEVAEIDLEINENEIENLKELSRVRNLGLHNRWEVDHKYLELTKRTDVMEGELRIVEVPELQSWHSSLIVAIHESCRKVSLKYVEVSEYPK